MEPAATLDGIRRWTSDYNGPATVEYDAYRLRSGGTGFALSIYHNNTRIWSRNMPAGSSPTRDCGSIDVELAVGDTLKFVTDAQADSSFDWAHFHARIMQREWADKPDSDMLFHYTMDETVLMPSGEGVKFDRRSSAIDHSGSNNHAWLINSDNDSAWVKGHRNNAFSLTGDSQAHAKVYPGNLGNGATELTYSA